MENKRNELKNKFKKGDKPTEVDYADLIDSFVNKLDDPYYKFDELPDAGTTSKGIVEQATLAEVDSGTDKERFVTPEGVKRAVEKFAPAAPVTSVNGKVGVVTIPDYTEATIWQNISLESRITKIGTTHKYGKKAEIVFLEGEININATVSGKANLFALSTGYRPENTIVFYVIGSTSNMVKIQIDSHGGAVATNVVANTPVDISLSGISFIAS